MTDVLVSYTFSSIAEYKYDMKMSSAMNILPVDMLRARRTVPLSNGYILA